MWDGSDVLVVFTGSPHETYQKKAARDPEGDDGRRENVIEGEAIKLHNAGKNALFTGAILTP